MMSTRELSGERVRLLVSSFEPSDKIRGLMPIWRESAKALRSLRQDELGPL